MSSFDNLLSSDGRKFTAKIQDVFCSGEIRVADGTVYLLQNNCDGDRPYDNNRRGYVNSWNVSSGTSDDLDRHSVKEFNFVSTSDELNLLDKEDYEFSARINSIYVEGIIHVSNGIVYLCQNSQNGTRPTDKDYKGFKYSWSVHSGTVSNLASEDVNEFVLKNKVKRCSAVVDFTTVRKFPIGTKIISRPGVTNFVYGSPLGNSIIRVPGTVVEGDSEGYKTSYNSHAINVKFNGHSGTWYVLESEFELYNEPEKVSRVSRFKVGDKVKIIGPKPYEYGGEKRDKATICEICGWNSDRKHIKVEIEFADGITYTMAEHELAFLTEESPFRRAESPIFVSNKLEPTAFEYKPKHSSTDWFAALHPTGPETSDYLYDDKDVDDRSLKFKTVKRFSI